MASGRTPNMASLARHDNPYTEMRNLKWSPAEKAIARQAFDLALSRELDATIREAKDRAAKITQLSQLWDLEHYLTQRRKHIDRLFDFRYSVLPLVFGNLIRQGRLSQKELHGLGEDKLVFIHWQATI
jgi:hypothetical protein